VKPAIPAACRHFQNHQDNRRILYINNSDNAHNSVFPKIFADQFPARQDRKNPPRRAQRHDWLAKATARAI